MVILNSYHYLQQVTALTIGTWIALKALILLLRLGLIHPRRIGPEVQKGVDVYE